MPANIDSMKMLKENEILESTTHEKLFVVKAEQSESESKWIKLHQMFDR